MRLSLRLVLMSCCLAMVLMATSQAKWDLAKDKNGIKVYTGFNGDSKFKAIKVEAVINGTLDKLIYLLLDAGSNKEWIYATNESHMIKRVSETETFSYTETSVPWPASNRDVIINMSLNVDRKNNSLTVIAKGIPKAIPEKKGIVRIPFFNSRWDVKFDGRNKLFINYFLEVDPGGSVPAWITNMFVARGPYETFNNLAAMMQK